MSLTSRKSYTLSIPRGQARFPSVCVSFGYTLNFDLVTDAASRGFLVLACHLARLCIARFPSVSAIRSADLENPTVEPTPRGDMAIWNFPNMTQMRKSVDRSVGRSPVGRSSIYTSSYTVLIYSSSLRQERSARGVKNQQSLKQGIFELRFLRFFKIHFKKT